MAPTTHVVAKSRAGRLVVQAVDGPDVGVLVSVHLPPVAVLDPNSPQFKHLSPQSAAAAAAQAAAVNTCQRGNGNAQVTRCYWYTTSYQHGSRQHMHVRRKYQVPNNIPGSQ